MTGDPGMGNPALFALLPLAVFGRPKRGNAFVLLTAAVAWGIWGGTARTARYMYPAGVLVGVVGGLKLGRGRSPAWAGARWAIAALALLSAGMEWERLAGRDSFRFLSGQQGREERLADRYTTWWDAVQWLNRNVQARGKVLFTGEERRLWIRPRVQSGLVVMDPVFWRLTRDSFTPGEVHKRVRQYGLTHLLHNFVSAEYRREMWFAGPPWTPRQLALYRGYFREYCRVVREPDRVDRDNGGFYVYEIGAKAVVHPPDSVFYLPDAEGVTVRTKRLMSAGKYAAAIAEYRDLLAIVPGIGFFSNQLGLTLLKSGDASGSYRILKTFVDSGMVDGLNLPVFGSAALDLGRYEEAERALARYADLFPEASAADLLKLSAARLYLAQKRIKAGRRDEASRLLDGAEAVLTRAAADPGVSAGAGRNLNAVRTLRVLLRRAEDAPGTRASPDGRRRP